MPRTAAQLRTALEESYAAMPETGWPAGEEYRRHMTLEHGGDPDDLVCAICGAKVAHKDARILIGAMDYDRMREREAARLDPYDQVTLPPLAFCPKHLGDEYQPMMAVSVNEMPARAKAAYSKLRRD